MSPTRRVLARSSASGTGGARYHGRMSRLGGSASVLALVLAASCQTADRLWRVSPFDEEAASERVNLWPLAYRSGDELSVLWPLFDVDSRGFALRPLVAKDGSAWSVLFVLASFDTDAGEGWAGPFYSFGNNAGLFPLANVGRFSWVGPVWWTGESRGLFPLAMLGNEFSYVGPAWWSRGDDGSAAGGLFPVAWFGSTNVIGPLWWDADDEGHGLFPLYGTDFLGLGVTHVGPVWWGSDAERGTRFGLAPLVSYADEGRSFAFHPFYSHRLGADARSRNVLLGLGHWSSDEGGHENWFAPLWYDRAAGDARDTVLFPFYWKHRRGDSADVYTLLGNRSVDPESKSFNLYPFWWSNESADSSWRMCVPFFWYGREGDERTLLTPLGGRGWSESGERAFVNVLGPLYHHSTSTRRDEELTAFLWPLFERHREGPTTETRLAAGLYERTTTPEDAESSFAFGLGHSTRRAEGSAHRFWPLWSWSDGLESPGFVYDLTLFGRERVGERTETRLFPLFSSSESPGETRWDALLGLAHHDRAGGESSTWVWPFYARSHGRPTGFAEYLSLFGSTEWDEGRSTQLGLSLLWSADHSETRERKASHERALVLFTHEEEEALAPLVPAADPDSRANRVRSESHGFLFDTFVRERATYRVWNDGVLAPDEIKTLRAFDAAAAREGVPDAAAVQSILATRGAASGDGSTDSLRAALADFSAANTRTYEHSKWRLPLVFGYERSDDELDWYGPLGLVRYERDPERSRFSLLYYGYRRETRGERTTRDIFPFITWDTAPGSKDISFLWRLFHYERKGERVGGHVLFFPWGDA